MSETTKSSTDRIEKHITLEDAGIGTKLTIAESGFDAIPEARRMTAFTGNTGGWVGQLENIRKFLAP